MYYINFGRQHFNVPTDMNQVKVKPQNRADQKNVGVKLTVDDFTLS